MDFLNGLFISPLPSLVYTGRAGYSLAKKQASCVVRYLLEIFELVNHFKTAPPPL
jgi:hypothetical protein